MLRAHVARLLSQHTLCGRTRPPMVRLETTVHPGLCTRWSNIHLQLPSRSQPIDANSKFPKCYFLFLSFTNDSVVGKDSNNIKTKAKSFHRLSCFVDVCPPINCCPPLEVRPRGLIGESKTINYLYVTSFHLACFHSENVQRKS